MIPNYSQQMGSTNEIANVLHVHQKLAKDLSSEIRNREVGRIQCALCRGDYPQQVTHLDECNDLLKNSMRKVVDVHAMTSYKSGVAKTWVYIILLDLYYL